MLEALMHDPRITSSLESVKIPTRVIWGHQDKIVPLECGELYSKAIKGSELVIINNCGHSPKTEQPVEFTKIALEFLS